MKKLIFVFFALIAFSASAQNAKTARPLYDVKTIGEIRLLIPVKSWTDALDSMRANGAKGMISGSAMVDGVKYEGAGIRYRGDKSYITGQKRNPFTVKLNFSTPEQNHQGYTTLKISPALRDPSMVREILFHEIAGKYMPGSQACYTKLYINEEYIGIFVNLEPVEHAFLTRTFGHSSGALFKAGVDDKPTIPANCKQNIFGSLEYEDDVQCYKGNFELESSADEGWNELQNLTRTLNQDLRNIETKLDVDQTLWMLALNNVMVNLNSYSGNVSVNYYLYMDGANRFHPIHWDLNLAFGSYKNIGVGSDLELRQLQELDPLLHADNPYKPLISALLKDDFYRKIYLAHVKQILQENFWNGTYEKRAQELQGMIVVPFYDSKYNLYSLDEFQRSLRETIGKRSKIPGIVELMNKRGAYLKKHPELTALPPAILEVNSVKRDKLSDQKVNRFNISVKADRFPKRLVIYHRQAAGQPFTATQMTEESAPNLKSGEKMFTVSLEGKSADAVLEYYIVAENAGAVSFAPLDYTKKPYQLKLSDLNK